MKRLLLILIYACSTLSLTAQDAQPAQNALHVATALNHLTVLEFHEPVTMAAAGSSDFQIERQGDKVFIKPTKPDASTDLLIWTQSKRFAYELETTAEVRNMNFTIDAAVPVRQPSPTTSMDEVADTLLTRALLGTVEIKSRQRKAQDRPAVQIDQIFRTRSTVYIHYRIQNNTEAAYRPGSPSVFELRPEHSSMAVGSLVHMQLDEHDIKKLGTADVMAVVTARAESDSQKIESGSSSQGVIALRQDFSTPTVLQVEFNGKLKATFVL
jgi:hypothetical protein